MERVLRISVKPLVRLLAVVLLTFFVSVPSSSAETRFVPLGKTALSGGLYCAKDSLGFFLAHSSSGELVETPVQLELQRVRQRIQRLKNKRNKLVSRIRATRKQLRRLNELLSEWKRLRAQIRQCVSGRFNADLLNQPGSEDLADGSPVNACAVASTGYSIEDDLPEQPGFADFPVSFIFGGNRCDSRNSAIIELVTVDFRGFEYLCSATAIDDQHVVTAAHCVEGIKEIRAVIAGGVAFARDFEAHPAYPSQGSDEIADIAIVRFPKRTFTRVFRLAKRSPETGEYGVIAGYGVDEKGRSGTLAAGSIRVRTATESTLTTTYSGGELAGTCSGDSGGPLLVEQDGEWVLAGVTSWGTKRNCSAGDIAFYSNLLDPANLSFIADVLGIDS